jgi:hypothetical protein
MPASVLSVPLSALTLVAFKCPNAQIRVLRPLKVNTAACLELKLCSLVDGYQRFRGAHSFHFRVRRKRSVPVPTALQGIESQKPIVYIICL